jgi:hypothetical protein
VALTISLVAAALIWPPAALAHGLLGRAYLPVPAYLFAWAAGIVLAASFVALAKLWPAPRLEHPTAVRIAPFPAAVEVACGAVGVAFVALIVYAGLAGTQSPYANLAPTAVFVTFWVGVPVLSAFLGDVFSVLNPWRACARCIAWLAGRTGIDFGPPLRYPPRLGRWPAAIAIAGFAWLELVYAGRQHPATVAVLTAAYALVQLVGMTAYGVDVWTERADGFAVAFGLIGRLAPLFRENGGLWRRPPLSGLAAVQPQPGTVALLCAMIGSTTFDGFANGPLWRDAAKPLTRFFGHLGLGATGAVEAAYTLGLIFCVCVCAALYLLGIRGMGTVSADVGDLAQRFAHSLVPIAFGYILAHYFSLLVTQGQAIGPLLLDPLGRGARFSVDYKLVGTTAIWYVQVLALIGGHVSGLALAHDRALVVYADPAEAAASQRWMLIVMVTFTSLGLWLLSAVYT